LLSEENVATPPSGSAMVLSTPVEYEYVRVGPSGLTTVVNSPGVPKLNLV
jgi:hypothetical protein